MNFQVENISIEFFKKIYKEKEQLIVAKISSTEIIKSRYEVVPLKIFLAKCTRNRDKNKIKNLNLCLEYHQALVIKLYNFSKLKRDIVWSVTTNTE